jgi:hypothetical protein
LSQLFSLRKWLTLEEVAKSLAKELVEDISAVDLLRLAIDESLKVSLLVTNGSRAFYVETDDKKSKKESCSFLGNGTWELYGNAALTGALQNRIFALERRALVEEIEFDGMAIVGKEGRKLTLYIRYSKAEVLERLEGSHRYRAKHLPKEFNPPVALELDRLQKDYWHKDWFSEIFDLLYSDQLVVTQDAFNELKILLASSKYLPENNLTFDKRRNREATVSQSSDEPIITSTNPNESENLRTLRIAAQKFWANANRDDGNTHPKNEDVKAWLMAAPHNFSLRLADSGATLIRPNWAARGRRSEE